MEVAGRHRAQLQGALIKSAPELEALEATLHTIQEAEEDLKRSAELLQKEVEHFSEGYIRAVQEHRVRILQDIEEEARRKNQALSLQRARIRQQLTDLHTATTFTRGLLDHGPDLHIVRAKALVLGRLKELNQGNQSQVDQAAADRIVFNAKDEAGLCRGYQMYGVVQRVGVDPERCQVRGQGDHFIIPLRDIGNLINVMILLISCILHDPGLQSVQQGKLCSFTLTCNSKAGDRQEHKGAPPRVVILHKDSGRSVSLHGCYTQHIRSSLPRLAL